MNYRTHRVGGICSGIVSASLFIDNSLSNGVLFASVLVVGSYIGSILPDIDHPNSKVGKKCKPISLIINKTCGHRGLIHSPLFALIFGMFLMVLGNYFNGFSKLIYSMFALGLIIGYVSHILMDSLTKGGIPFLFPISNKTYGLKLFRTNKHEALVTVLTLILTGVFFFLK